MTRKQLTGHLYIHEYDGLMDWADRNGHAQGTVNAAVNRHLGRKTNPRGKTRQILHELEALTGQQLYTRPSKTIAPKSATPGSAELYSARAAKGQTQQTRKTA